MITSHLRVYYFALFSFKTSLFLQWVIGKADQFAWARMWNACKLETEDTHPKLAKGSTEYFAAVSDRFNEVIDRTQVIDTVFHRSQIMRSNSSLMKIVTSFMSEPTRQYNMLRLAVANAKNGKPGAGAKCARVMTSVISSMIVNSMGYAVRNGLWVTGDYQPGDLVLFNWHGENVAEHIGIVESVREDGTVIAIEGNTSITSNDNGGSVMRRERSPSNILGAVRPLYESEDEDMLEYEDFKAFMKQYEDEKADEAASNWGDEADLARAWAKENGILVGDTQGRPQYKAYCTREMMVLFMYRLYGLIKKLVGKSA